ncbi:M15 family metallopeptidase [Formosa haliotis]|uniref:M15 family metallopeptidase n=1 Tax=Formosa haliotis TaxID=1555194 RepID=UPI00082489CE|nr:M15 family metallopeptidase [Formosa haliotis]
MNEAAKADGIHFKIVSGTRNFNEQKAIWDRKWKRYQELSPIERAKKILQYSSMPSTSRHHWGTDIDLNHLTNSYFESGQGLKEYNWLQEHAHTFGFYQVYTSKEHGRTGYLEEKWHWSYLPLASTYLSFYNSNISYQDITNFKGSEFATELQMITNYVNGIAMEAKHALD